MKDEMKGEKRTKGDVGERGSDEKMGRKRWKGGNERGGLTKRERKKKEGEPSTKVVLT